MTKVIRTVLLLLALVGLLSVSACSTEKDSKPVSIDNVKSVVFESEFPEMVELGKNQLSNYYTFDQAWISDFSVYIADSEILCDEVAIFRLADDQYLNNVVAAIEQRVNSQFSATNAQNQIESAKTINRILLLKDDMVVMVISEHGKEISKQLQKKYGFKEI